MQTLAKVLKQAGTMSEYSEIEKEFQRLQAIVKDVGGIGKLSNEKYEEIVQFCRLQSPKCPQCGERNTKFRYIENKKSARTLQPRFKCSICKVREDNKERDFTWGGKRYRERFTEQSSIHQEPQDYQTGYARWSFLEPGYCRLVTSSATPALRLRGTE